jgi:hypothetical protein
MWQAEAAQICLGDQGDPGRDPGVDQRTDPALAAVRHCMVDCDKALTADFDSSWGKYPPSILYRHARRHCLFIHQIGLQPIIYRRKQLSIA